VTDMHVGLQRTITNSRTSLPPCLLTVAVSDGVRRCECSAVCVGLAAWPAASVTLPESCGSLCVSVRVLKAKRLELSTPNLVHVYPEAAASRNEVKKSRSRSYQMQLFN